MSSHARWGGFRIVEPQVPVKENLNLVGGLKNALERGETLEKAKQSFINAGYKPEEVSMAAQKVPAVIPKIDKPTNSSIKIKTSNKLKKPIISKPTSTAPKQQKQVSKTFTIILISLAVVMVIGLVLVGIFWDKLF